MVTFLVTINNAEARKPLSLQCFFDLYFGFNSRHQLFLYLNLSKFGFVVIRYDFGKPEFSTLQECISQMH